MDMDKKSLDSMNSQDASNDDCDYSTELNFEFDN